MCGCMHSRSQNKRQFDKYFSFAFIRAPRALMHKCSASRSDSPILAYNRRVLQMSGYFLHEHMRIAGRVVKKLVSVIVSL